MLCIDTEDDTQGTVKIVNFFDGANHTTFRGDNCRYKAWGFLHEKGPQAYWMTNAEYDLVNLFGPWLTRLVTLSYVASGFMRGTFTEKKGVIFYDTLRHWPASVKRMGEIIGLEKLEMPHIGCDCDDCVTYCRRDTEITWTFVDEMLARYDDLGILPKSGNPRSTLPSMAMQLFKKFYMKEFEEIPENIKEFLRAGYYGGRVEVYQMGKITGVINHYDVNSLFPSVMVDYSYPDLSTWYPTDKPNLNKEGMFCGWIKVPQCEYPCIPYRADEIIFPWGGMFGTWAYPEIRQLLEDGGEIIKTKECIEFDGTENPFDGYVDFCYKQRLASTNDVDSLFWKLMMNSLYGKFGQSRGLQVISDDEEKTIGGTARHANVIWSAYVTCYARLRLLDYLRRTTSCFYTDTDSLFTFDTLDTSKDLGKLKLEAVYKSAEFKGNKIYCVDDKAKAKGVKPSAAWDFFKHGKAIIRKPMRLRESRRRGLIPNIWGDTEKKNLKEYSKRIVRWDGSTEAWNIDEYREAFKKGLIS